MNRYCEKVIWNERRPDWVDSIDGYCGCCCWQRGLRYSERNVMLEVSFEQVLMVGAGIGTVLTGAIGFLVKWVLNEVAGIKNDLKDCEAKHSLTNAEVLAVNTKCARVEAKLEARDEFKNDLAEVVVKLVEARIISK